MTWVNWRKCLIDLCSVCIRRSDECFHAPARCWDPIASSPFSFICTSIRFIPISSLCCYCIKLIVSSPDRRDQVLYILLFSISMTNANESVSLPFPLLSLAFISFSSSSLFTANNTIYQLLIRPPLVENGGIWTVIGEGLSSILWYKKGWLLHHFSISWHVFSRRG